MNVAVSRVPALGVGVAVSPLAAACADAASGAPAADELLLPACPGMPAAGASSAAADEQSSEGKLTADTTEQVVLGNVSSKSDSIDYKVSDRIRTAHSADYPNRIRDLNWPLVRTSYIVPRHL